jgi:hypothetical protein
MYNKLNDALLHTREDFATVCNQLRIDPEWADISLLGVVMCDNCGMWENRNSAYTKQDGTVFCKACDFLEDARF